MVSKGGSLVFFLILACHIFQCYAVQDAVTKGETARMYCYDPNNRAYRNFFTKVFYNGNLIANIYQEETGYTFSNHNINNNQKGRYDIDQTGHLMLKLIEYSDRGEYKCKAEGIGLEDNVFSVTNLTVYVPPDVLINRPKVYLQSGAESTKAVDCIAENGNPQAEVRWSMGRHLDFEEEESVNKDATSPGFVTVTKSLVVTPTKYYNNQEFICTVTHPAFETALQKIFVMNVTYAPEVPVIEVNRNLTRLTCTADANPPPTYTWVLPNKKVVKGSSTPFIAPSNSDNNEDLYTCKATNMEGAKEKTIKRSEAMVQRESLSKSSTGVIIGVVIGVIFLLALIMGLVYIFLLKPSRSKDPGPYLPTTRDSVRPMIEHPHGGRPPSPRQPPPPMTKLDDETSSDEGDAGSSYSDEEGRHDVDIEVNPYTTVVDPAKVPVDGTPMKPGITSRASLNFQARRQRPTASPSYRNSTHQQQQNDGSAAPPPRRSASRSTIENNRPFSYGMPPRPNDSDGLPPYEGHYSEIDHGNYKAGPVRRTEEPVEYAQIRKYSGSHVV